MGRWADSAICLGELPSVSLVAWVLTYGRNALALRAEFVIKNPFVFASLIAECWDFFTAACPLQGLLSCWASIHGG